MTEIIHDTLFYHWTDGNGDPRRRWVGESYIQGGRWTLATDYGVASYYWHAHGYPTLKEFLAKNRDPHYLIIKLWSSPLVLEEPDWEQTRVALFRQIVEEARYDRSDAGKAKCREWFDDLRFSDSVEEYKDQEHSIPEWWEFIVYDHTSAARAFREHVIVPFITLFQEQLANAQAPDAPK